MNGIEVLILVGFILVCLWATFHWRCPQCKSFFALSYETMFIGQTRKCVRCNLYQSRLTRLHDWR